MVERYFDVVDVRGSTPLPPTGKQKRAGGSGSFESTEKLFLHVSGPLCDNAVPALIIPT